MGPIWILGTPYPSKTRSEAEDKQAASSSLEIVLVNETTNLSALPPNSSPKTHSLIFMGLHIMDSSYPLYTSVEVEQDIGKIMAYVRSEQMSRRSCCVLDLKD